MNNKIVYFVGAIRGDSTVVITVLALVRFIQRLGLFVLTDHVAAEDSIATFASKLGKTKERSLAEDIERQDIAWLDQAIHVVVEISGANTGNGRKIKYTHKKKHLGKTPAKILVLYDIKRKFFVSPMVLGMTTDPCYNVKIKSYETLEDAQKIVRKFLDV